jgi:opacity protein-like surface antigen
MRRLLPIAIFVSSSVIMAAPALADGFVTPSIGANFGGDAGTCASASGCSSKHITYGVAAGFMGAGILGIEEEVSYAPNFFGSVPALGNNGVLTAMTNVIVGAPLGPVRPYVSGGIGVIRLNANLAPGGIATVNNTSFGYDIGGGVMRFFTSHVGLQADYHYLRSTRDVTLGGFSITNTELNFSRGTVGVVFRF